MHHPKLERQQELREASIKLARKLNIPLVATQDSHYLNPEDAKAHDTLVAIQTSTNTGDTKRFSNIEENFSFCSPEEMIANFSDTPEAITNTLKIAEACNLELELGKWFFPNYEIPADSNYNQELDKMTKTRLLQYIVENPEREKLALERIDYELGVISKKGYSPYFLVVADLIKNATERGIFTNTRGSAAGCFVAFLNGITNIDPLIYKLPFERFLNADRPSPPDIDMDFADKRRDEIIDYARAKYGTDQVAQIGTFGSMLARGSVRDVARALGYPYTVGDRLSKLIPLGSQGVPMTIDRALKETPELKEIYKTENDAKIIIDLAKKIEGGARHISVHAAGVVIAPSAITDFVPVQFDPHGEKIITQYDMHAVEEAGLLKFDFLGIRNLSILEDSIKIVRKTQGLKINLNQIPLDDKKTFAMLAHGDTIGLFQLNGAGMTRWLKELKPNTIFDINAMVALYRPGPMEMIPEYIKRKHNPKTIKYLDPRMKDILEHSFGVITYQDDVMLVAIQLAGYSWTEADKLRKAMGKKIPKEMEAQKEKLHQGLITNGMTEAKAEELWSLIEPFAAYGFNKAHAASYGRVAYQTAYMKANFTGEYMTAVLSAESGDVEEIAVIISECKKLDIPVLAPDVNESFGDFAVIKAGLGDLSALTPEATTLAQRFKRERDTIRFGLYTIKNLGKEISDFIVEERKRGGPYLSYQNFLERVTHKNMNKKSLEALIKSGALDSLGEERGAMIANIEEALTYNKESGSKNIDQISIFGLMNDSSTIPALKFKPSEPVSMKLKLAWEKELLGLYLSGHPLAEFQERFDQAEHNIKSIKTLSEDSVVIIGAVVETIREITTKKGEHMAFVKIADFNDQIETVFFSRIYNEHRDLIQADKCLAIKGRISFRNGEPSLIVESLKELI